jgi:hypothetical protein
MCATTYLMKHSDSTEMDRLLRRYARRNGETMRAISGSQSSGSRSNAPGAHMDADEVSAYAEGALPEAARSRYVAHLADCDACRKIVTDLTLASGAVVEIERAGSAVADASPSKSWREWLAALFSPPVLRYGVPALVLLAVIVVAFVATRTQRERQFTARNETVANQGSATADAANTNMPAQATDTIAESHSSSNEIVLNEQQKAASSNTATTTTTATAPVQTGPADQDAPSAPQARASQTTDQTPGTVAAREQSEAEVLARKDDATTSVPSPPPPPQATPAPKTASGRDKQGAQKKSGEERDEEKIANQPAPSTGGVASAQNEVAEDRNTASKSEGMSARSNRARRPVFGAAKTATPNTESPKERAAETRQVAGRQFRRQGNAWVDTAYKSSHSLTNVARGSEQYRALVADEPGLRTVAQQLGGEVIVVWKSRAYRFH